MIVPTKKLFEVAYGKFAVGAYNINNAEQTMGLFRGCVASAAPFIIQISKGARRNTDTDGRLVWTRVHREYFRDKPADFDFRGPGKLFIEEYAKFIAGRNVLLGSAGQLEAVREHVCK